MDNNILNPKHKQPKLNKWVVIKSHQTAFGSSIVNESGEETENYNKLEKQMTRIS